MNNPEQPLHSFFTGFPGVLIRYLTKRYRFCYHEIVSKFEKLKLKIKNGQTVSYEEAEGLLLKLGFKMRSPGSSHFIFWKEGYEKNIALKKRSQLLSYQIRLLEEVLKKYEQE